MRFVHASKYFVTALVSLLAVVSEASADPIEQAGSKPFMPGLTLEAEYIGDVVRNLDAGIVANDRKTAYLGLIDIGVNFDTEKNGWWQGGTFHVHALNTHGGQPSASHIGDLQVVDNIEAAPATILYEAWYEQQFGDHQVSVLAGLHDLNSEFYVSDTATLFLNSSFGIGAEMFANVPTSIFPRPGLGVRFRYQPFDSLDFAVAAYDGDPSTRRLSKREGYLGIAELAYRHGQQSGRPGSLKLGAWQHKAMLSSPSGQAFPRDYGGYLLVDQRLANLGGGLILNAFIRYGVVPSDRNTVISNLSTGLSMSGLFTGRVDDVLGLGVTRAVNTYAPGQRGSETTWEMTYQISLGEHVTLQPSLQWIQHPQGDPANRNIRVVLGRLNVEL